MRRFGHPGHLMFLSEQSRTGREQEQAKISNNLFLFLVINFLVRGFILFEFQVMTLS